MKFLLFILILGNLIFGMFVVIMVIYGEFVLVVIMIWVVMFFDLFDGFVVWKLYCEGEFGKVLDFLVDVIFFGIVLVLILYLNFMNEVSVFGMVLMVLFLVCGVLCFVCYNC